ncbi:MAG: glucarate dehydratase [marine bacterium B5-7]|nr:MAG: glucarate dehydratase [marine bacterium B5-7]
MRVISIRLNKITVPLRKIYLSSRSLLRSYDRVIVTILTDEGLCGYGEADGSDRVFHFLGYLSQNMIGQDLLEWTACPDNQLDSASASDKRAFNIAKGGLEIAYFDLLGKYLELPVYKLLGGAVKTQIPMVCELSAAPLGCDVSESEIKEFFKSGTSKNRVVESAIQQIDRYGYKTLKMKSIGHDPQWDIEVMTTLRKEAGPGIQLRHDPNGAYALPQAQLLYQKLDSCGLQWFEDPVSSIDDFRRLKRTLKTALATNMCIVRPDHLTPAIRNDTIDVIGVDLFSWGGYTGAQTGLTICDAYHLDVFGHYFFDLGIATAASLHLAAASRNMTNGVDTSLYLHDDDVIAGGRLKVKDGFLPVSDIPGLGIDLDDDALTGMTTHIESFS